MRNLLALMLVLTTTLAIQPGVSQAQERKALEFGDSVDQYLFLGDLYYLEGDLYRSITEYQRFLFHAVDDHRQERVRMKMAWVYNLGGEHRRAAHLLSTLAHENPDAPLGWWARYYYAQVAVEAGRPDLARVAYESIIEECTNVGDEDDATRQCRELVTNARLGLAGYHAGRHDFESAAAQLTALPEGATHAEHAALIARQVDGMRIPQKSPALAGALSIVPGLGHFYIEEYGIGLMAVVWNGIFIYGIVDSVLSRSYGQALLIGLIESIWYGGTIFGAVAGAHRFNRDANHIVETGLRRSIDQMADDTPWPARFPVSYMELQLKF